MAAAEGMNSELSDKAYRKTVNAWCMYDWANSAFATIAMAAVLPVFYSKVAGADLLPVEASSRWAATNTIAMLLVALAAPVLGAIADHSGVRKRLLGTFAAIGIVFTALLACVGQGQWLLASCLFVLGMVGFAGANIFYDSLLPHVARRDNIDQISVRGYAMGYIGGGLLLAINIGMIYKLGFANGARLAFLSVAVWWALFSIPLFRRVAEPPAVVGADESSRAVRAAFQRLGHTLRSIRRYRELFKFLLAFWLYNDGIGTVMKMAVIFGAEIGVGEGSLIGALLMAQFVGVPFAFAYGWLARRLGTKRSIQLGLAVYALIAIFGFFMQTAWHFWVLAFLVATSQGGTQALSRSLYGAMCPKAKTSEFFGFYDVSSKFAGILGPAVFAIVGIVTGSSRLSVLALLIFFVGGAALLLLVDEKEGIRVAREEDERAASSQGDF